MKTILVVDDLEAFRVSLERLLNRSGYRVLLAKDGQEALSQVENNHPDLILLDLNMPTLNGIGFLNALRSNVDRGTTPVILMTGQTKCPRVAEAEKFGVADSLVKASFSFAELSEKISVLLN